jgi:hypothetical protein
VSTQIHLSSRLGSESSLDTFLLEVHKPVVKSVAFTLFYKSFSRG